MTKRQNTCHDNIADSLLLLSIIRKNQRVILKK
jgi:hypothetical protein